jgi:hypothetical protein
MTTKKKNLKKSIKNTHGIKKSGKTINKKSGKTINVAELTKKLKENQDKGPVDEKGNPYPIENPDGGDPICPGGYKIDYQFDIFDPINPPFRCISALKEDGDGVADKLLKMANNPSDGVANIMTGPLPVFGGGRHRSRSHRLRRSRSRSRRRRQHRKSS